MAGISRDDTKIQIALWALGQHYEDTLASFYEALRNHLSAGGIELAKERRKDVVGEDQKFF